MAAAPPQMPLSCLQCHLFPEQSWPLVGETQPPERRPVFRDFFHHQPSGTQGEGYHPELQGAAQILLGKRLALVHLIVLRHNSTYPNICRC